MSQGELIGVAERGGAAGRHDRRRRRRPARRPAQALGRDRRPRPATSSSATRAWATSCRPALGVRLAQPEGEVYVFIGDGTYLMNPTELVTALQERLKITVVISENHGFQCIRRPADGPRRAAASATSSAHRDAASNRLDGDVPRARPRQERRGPRRAHLARRARRTSCARRSREARDGDARRA